MFVIKDVTSAGYKNYDSISFGWLITDWCNYKCSYCSSKGFLVEKFNREKYRTGLLVPFKLKKLDVDFKIDLAGGEPTVHPYLNKILKDLVQIDRCKSIVINTNLSRSLRYYKGLVNDNKIVISASYHAEHHNDEFIEKCIALKNRNIICHINLIDKKEYWENIKTLIAQCKENNIQYGFNNLHSTDFRDIEYTDEFYNTFGPLNSTLKDLYPFTFNDGTTEMLNPFEVNQRGLQKLYGYNCTTLKYLIGFDGTITRECNKDMISMFPSRKELFKTIRCPRIDGCDCNVMLNYYKELPNVHA
jgi:organic radical activating enzyme